jgi:23S rRNA pseudouridine2604 synthase
MRRGRVALQCGLQVTERDQDVVASEAEGTERIARIMARRGLCSRREAEDLIERGQVMVNGCLVRQQGVKATPDAEITILPQGAAGLASQVTVLLHKPPGVVSGRPEPGQTPAWQLLRSNNVHGDIEDRALARVLADPRSLSVAGRLDRASRGLLVLTEDGAIARRLVGGHDLTKTYEVRVDEVVTDSQLRKLGGALTLDGKRLLPMRVHRLSTCVLRFDLVEGRKHQIRRACRHVGLDVLDLFRIAIGPLKLGDLPEGCWRPATAAELTRLRGSREQARLQGAR